MGERADEIEQQIYQTRQNLGQNFNELQQRVKSAFDWRAQFEERPFTMMAVAFGGGVLLSTLLPSRGSRSDSDYVTDTDLTEGEQDSASKLAHSPSKRSDSWHALKGALVGVAANRLGGILSDLVLGYRRELDRTRETSASSLDGSSL